ncbi:hypothetical protein GCM10009560_51260 [Nonomuraea longicatena]|uniref:MalT-like TPR region domain-containing protein n=2 Tax=Nonomuraea longicatena TaxID=83682 RepID=A0ABN1QBS5_9ACTN
MRRPSHTIEVGLSWGCLGRSDIAVRLFEEGQAGRSLDYAHDTALGLTAIAGAQLEQGEIDGALENAGRAADLMATADFSRVADLLRAFFQSLPYGPRERPSIPGGRPSSPLRTMTTASRRSPVLSACGVARPSL